MSGCLWPKEFPLASISEERQCVLRGNWVQKPDLTVLMELSISRNGQSRGNEKKQSGRQRTHRDIGKRQPVDTVFRLCMGPAQPGAAMLTWPRIARCSG